MNFVKVSALLLIASTVSMVAWAGYGCCEPMDVEISLSQQRELDAAAERRHQKRRDAERAQRLALEELEAQRYQVAIAEQQYALEQSTQRKRQERRDEDLAQRIAQQELDAQRRLTAAEQQRLLDAVDRKARQERRDAELAQQLAQQEIDMQRRLAAAAQIEQERMLDEIARKARQERQDADLAQRIAQQEIEAQRRLTTAEQQRLYAEAEKKARQERQDADLARQIAQQDRETQKQIQIASDEVLAQQLYEEELRSARPNTRSQVYSSRTTPAAPAARGATRSVSGVSLTTAVPTSTDVNSLQNWIRTNDVLPTSMQADDTLCVVCLSSPDDLKKSQLVRLQCKHVFCRPCTQGLVANKAGSVPCPTCRSQSDVAAIKSVVGR
jgi:hypothetical protein